jgi:N-acetyl sugar amidotransferase
MNRCRLCVIPDTRPDTPFEDGVCSACRSFANRGRIDWAARAADFDDLMTTAITSTDSFLPYDCIVASSGGKDSHWQVLKMLELGYKPLIVTATTCMLTPIGRANIDNLARFAQTVEITPNRTVRAKLNRLGLELVGDISWPEHATIFNTPWAIAQALHIPIVIYGENPQEAYGGPAGTELAKRMTRRWVTEFGGFLGLRAGDLVGQLALTQEDMLPYTPINELVAHPARAVHALFLGSFFEWDSERNARVAKEHGMLQQKPCMANWWEAENLDNAMTGLHDHVMYRKYGYGRAAAQLSVDIRRGRVTRKDAIEFVRVYDGEVPYNYAGVTLEQVLKRIDMTEGELFQVLDRFTNWELFANREPHPLLKEFA